MAVESSLKKSPLDDAHRRMGARMVPFAGWEMPLQFAGVVEEHNAVRQRAGVFDVSHMGRLFVSGSDAAALLRKALTYNVHRLQDSRGHYALLCQEDGGIIDDVFVYRMEEGRFLVVDNAANAERDRDHIAALVEPGTDVRVEDRQAGTAMIAIQGPESPRILSEVLSAAFIERLPRHGCREFELSGAKAFIAQSGYTGENGYEMVTGPDQGRALWDDLIGSGAQPCGLVARDALRLEAALHLYGNDIDTSTDPFEAGLGWAVDLDDEPFVGKEALLRAKREGVRRQLACLKATGKGIMRAGCPILHRGQTVGRVTSGGFSPALGVSIGMGYLPPALAAEGTALEIDVRGKLLPAEVVRRPFYKRPL
jgi:aminomethyltransferase